MDRQNNRIKTKSYTSWTLLGQRNKRKKGKTIDFPTHFSSLLWLKHTFCSFSKCVKWLLEKNKTKKGGVGGGQLKEPAHPPRVVGSYAQRLMCGNIYEIWQVYHTSRRRRERPWYQPTGERQKQLQLRCLELCDQATLQVNTWVIGSDWIGQHFRMWTLDIKRLAG